MMKIKPYHFVFCFLFLMALGFKAQAADSSGAMLDEQNELRAMMADTDKSGNLTHKEWFTRNPFDIQRQVKETKIIAANGPKFILEGIFLGSDKPSAIINGAVVALGDKINDNTLQEINADSITLVDGGGNKIILSLKQ